MTCRGAIGGTARPEARCSERRDQIAELRPIPTTISLEQAEILDCLARPLRRLRRRRRIGRQPAGFADVQHLQRSRRSRGRPTRARALSADSETPTYSVQPKESSAAHATVEPAIASFVRRIRFMDLPHYWLAPFPQGRALCQIEGSTTDFRARMGQRFWRTTRKYRWIAREVVSEMDLPWMLTVSNWTALT